MQFVFSGPSRAVLETMKEREVEESFCWRYQGKARSPRPGRCRLGEQSLACTWSEKWLG